MKRRVSSGRYIKASHRKSIHHRKKSHQETGSERTPLTMEYLASLAAKECRGERVGPPILRRDLRAILHDSIHRMVEGYVWRYCTSSEVEKQDLSQECMKKIFASIGTYSPKKSKFTTWASTVCFSVLNKEYHKRIRWTSHIVQDDELLARRGEEESLSAVPSNPDMLRQDIIATVNILLHRNPEKRRFIEAIFGNPNQENYVMPTMVKIGDAAREAKMSYFRAKRFFRRVIRPIFVNRFAIS